MSLLQWNPHWQCFVHDRATCGSQAENALTAELQGRNVDFANIVELENEKYAPPAGWSSVRHKCGVDVTVLIYNSARWRPTAYRFSGCMVPDDRPFIVMQFDGAGPMLGKQVVVTGAHYPHSGNRARGPLKGALAAVVAQSGVKDVVLLADTNEDQGVSADMLAQDIGMPASARAPRGTQLLGSCCLDIGFIRPFDRIVANFGAWQGTALLFEPLPAWPTGQFHKAIAGTLLWQDAVAPAKPPVVRQLLEPADASAAAVTDSAAEAEQARLAEAFWLRGESGPVDGASNVLVA